MKKVNCTFCRKRVLDKKDLIISSNSKMYSGAVKLNNKLPFFPDTPYHRDCYQREIDEIERIWDKKSTLRPDRHMGGELHSAWDTISLTNPVGFINVYILFILIFSYVFYVSLENLIINGLLSSYIISVTLSAIALLFCFYVKLRTYLKYERYLS